MKEPWPIWVLRVLAILGINAVPIWGFTEEQWTPGTALALYWLQTLFAIPITAVLIVMHRRLTHKLGHYRSEALGTTFLSGFLWMNIPFVIAHGIFLAFILGVVWKDASGGIDREDLRIGAIALLNLMGLHFAADTFNLGQRPFAFIRRRALTLLQRTFVIHFVIILGMGVAAFAKADAAAFFAVFMVLKLLGDLAGELPEWMPTRTPWWILWIAKRQGKVEAIEELWAKESAGLKATLQADERSVTPEELRAAVGRSGAAATTTAVSSISSAYRDPRGHGHKHRRKARPD